MITIHVPRILPNEIEYTISVLLGEFLGIEYSLKADRDAGFSLESGGKSIELPSTFFQQANDAWLSIGSMPQQPLLTWDTNEVKLVVNLTDRYLPVLYGTAEFIESNNAIRLGLDIFGSSFFMLSRYEELVITDRDGQDRFPATASLAYQEGFLQRPIVNEYLELLWACINKLWPALERKQRGFSKQITCDVDHPYQCGIHNPIRQLKHIAGDLVRRRSLVRATFTVINYFTAKMGNFGYDSNYSRLKWMMDINEQAGNRLVFYFICGHSNQDKDGCYTLDKPVIRELISEMCQRGHEVGLHPSYNTYQNLDQLGNEVQALKEVLGQLGCEQGSIKSRQHYLRWENPTTPRYLEDTGVRCDSSMSYADRAGFRCGVCYEYPLYDLEQRRMLKVVEQPLIVMEVSLLSRMYAAIDNKDELLSYVENIMHKVRRFNGTFTLLWHNTSFDKKWHEECYKEILRM